MPKAPDLSSEQITTALEEARQHLAGLVAESRSRELELYSLLRVAALLLEPGCPERALRLSVDRAGVALHRELVLQYDRTLVRAAGAIAARARALLPESASLELHRHLERDLLQVSDPASVAFTAAEVALIEQRAAEITSLLGYPAPEPHEESNNDRC